VRRPKFRIASTDTAAQNVLNELAKDQREALGMLAASLRGRMESVMEAHGVAIGTLRGLVRAGLATADRGPAYFNRGAIVTILQITEAGRQAIAD
jgi:hypothetical protein